MPLTQPLRLAMYTNSHSCAGPSPTSKVTFTYLRIANFIPSLTNSSPPNDLECDLLGLPLRLEGLGITNPTRISTGELSTSKSISSPLSNLIKEQQLEYPLSASRLKSQQRRQSTNNVETTLRSLRLSLEVLLQLLCREPVCSMIERSGANFEGSVLCNGGTLMADSWYDSTGRVHL